jgi:hypothetical protein
MVDTAARPFLTIGQTTGPRNARTDPKTGIRWYTWQGVEYPSVTTIRRLAGIPHRLAEWQIGQVAGRAIERIAEYHQRLSTADPEAAALVKTELRQAAVDKREARAAFGTAVHQAIEGGLALTDVGPDLAPRLRQFLDWRRRSGVEILGQELQGFHLEAGYAGSVDLLGRFPDGSIWVIDYKTGGDNLTEGVYPDQLLQLLPYLMAEFVGEDDRIDEPLTALLHQATGVALLHLVDDGWEFRSLEATPDAWGAFLGLLRFSRWMAAHPDMDSVTLGVRKGKA